MIYGYARVSTDSQKIDRQIKTLEDYSTEIIIYKETYSSLTVDRPQFNKLVKILKNGDTLILDSVSRFSRDSEEGKELYFKLVDRGVNLIFLKEEDINSSVIMDQINKALKISLGVDQTELIKATEDYIKTILIIQAKEQVANRFNQAEKEIMDIRQRTKEGLERARANGKQIGRVKGSIHKTKRGEDLRLKLVKHHRAFNGSMTDKEFIDAFNLSKSTLVKYKKILREERENPIF